MLETGLSGNQKLVLAAAVGTGVVVGASGIIVYQRLSQNVSLSVTGRDFSQELTTLSQNIEKLRQDLEDLRGNDPRSGYDRTLKSVLKKTSSYGGYLDTDELLDLPSSRTLGRSWSSCSSMTNGSSGTEYFSALSSDEEGAKQEIILNSSYEEDVDESVSVLHQVDELMEGKEEQQIQALDLLLQFREQIGDTSDYFWRLCKAEYLLAVLAGQNGDTEKKKEMIMRSVESGKSALSADENNSEAHKWFAIALGSRGEFGGVREKILDGFEFKKHIDKAAELNPRDYITHHLLGRFCYEVSQLSWLERKMAATLFAEPPSATLSEAIQHFMAAERMKPEGWKENRLFIAKCHIGLREYSEAVIWLDKADSIPLAPSHYREGIKDRISQEEIHGLITKYQGYRL